MEPERNLNFKLLDLLPTTVWLIQAAGAKLKTEPPLHTRGMVFSICFLSRDPKMDS